MVFFSLQDTLERLVLVFHLDVRLTPFLVLFVKFIDGFGAFVSVLCDLFANELAFVLQVINSGLSELSPDLKTLCRTDLCLQQALIEVDQWLVFLLRVASVADSVLLRVTLTQLNLMK